MIANPTRGNESDNRPRLTIAVPFVSDVAYVRRTLDSIFAQRSRAWTSILIDNSFDPAERVAVASLCATYDSKLLRYIATAEHVGANANFNRYFDLAETDLVASVHSDDEVLPHYSDEILELADRHPDATVLFVRARIIDAVSRPAFSAVDFYKRFLVPRGTGDIVLEGEQSLRSLVRGNWINGAAVCFRRSALGDFRWDVAYPMASDLDLWSRILCADQKLAGSRADAPYAYRRHKKQTTAKLTANFARFYEEADIHDLIATRATQKGWSSVARVARRKTIIRLHLGYLAMLDITRGAFGAAIAKGRLAFSLDRRAP